MPRARVILNPLAGRAVPLADLVRLLQPLEADGWEITLAATDLPGETTALARAAVADGCEVVVAVGGDGTVNEVMQALVGTRVALGVLPTGTGNVWAAQVGIPTDLARAVKVLREGWLRRVDVGIAGDRYFLLMAGVGYDAAVTRSTSSKTKRRLGILAYVVAGVSVALGYVGWPMTINVNGDQRQYRALLVVLGNSRRYGGPVSVTAEARIDDGLLDVCVFKGVGFLHAAWYVFAVLLGRHLRDPGVVYFRAARLRIGSERTLFVQVDGETIGTTPMAFGVRPRALSVVVPFAAAPGLFTAAEPSERLGGQT